jgi:hypothetical protein
MEETTQGKSQKCLIRCHQCGRVIETPYKSYILSLGDCCGMELLDFCSEECFEKSGKENS